MPKIVYIEPDGQKHEVEVASGRSLMQGALEHGLGGIIAECGGSCACGTCRVHIDPAWRERTGEASEIEEAVMEVREDPSPDKRLSCQIAVTEALDGLVVRIMRN